MLTSFDMTMIFFSFPLQTISPTTLFLAAKVEEQPRKLEHVIKVAHACLNPQEPPLDTKSNVSPKYYYCFVISSSISSTFSSHWIISATLASIRVFRSCHYRISRLTSQLQTTWLWLVSTVFKNLVLFYHVCHTQWLQVYFIPKKI